MATRAQSGTKKRALKPSARRAKPIDEEFLLTVFNVARIGICLTDDAGFFVRVNPAFCELVGYQPDELIGRHYSVAAPPRVAAQAAKFLAAALAGSPRIPAEWQIRRKNGEFFDALVSFTTWTPRPDARHLVITFTDVTARNEAQAQVRQLNRQLEERIAERTAQIRRQSNVLLKLSELDKTRFEAAVGEILAADAATLGVERVSYWTFASAGDAISCHALYRLTQNGLDSEFVGTVLAHDAFPNYFQAILENRPVVAHRAHTHPATAEFRESYLAPLGITAMLDVPVWFQSKVVGVICHEHVGAAREWSAEEVDFASSIAHMISLSLEAAQRQKLIEALENSERKFRDVVENASEVIILVQDGLLKYANPQTAQFSGYGFDELYSLPFLHFVHPEDRALVGGNYLKRLRGEPAAQSYEFRIVDKSGAIRWVLINAVAMDWEGKPATLNFLTEISERKALQDDLRRNIDEREALLQSTLVGITFVIERKQLWFNDTFARMLGYEREELMGESSLMHYPDRASYEAFGAAAYPVLASGRPYVAEQQMKRKDGSLIWIQLYGHAVDPNDLGKGSIWTNVDITERKRAEEDIRHALEKERELSELKSRFVAMTSHEFRTPLATILSSAELLERYGERMPAAEKTELFDSVRTGVERMAKMLDDVLMIGRVESQMIEFTPAPLDLAAFCQRLVDETRRSLQPHHELNYRFDGRPREVNMDEKLLRHVLGNLLSNAIKYSPSGGRVELHVQLGDRHAGFSIKDEGIGIPLEDQPRLFESFHRARNVGNIAGTGLGMAIVRKSVDLQGGQISFDSATGRGSRFTVSIPLN